MNSPVVKQINETGPAQKELVSKGPARKVSIQGFEGSFHQEAARVFFGKNVEVICCSTFREVVKLAANKKESDGGVMAIENSIAGSILPNYNLLQKSNLTIKGEVYLQINQNLMVNPGVKLEDIREVHSHPMAIQQCFGFLDKYNWKLVETEDTALSARHIHQHRSKHIAAIASKLAAEIYRLNMIAPNIHTLKNNYTRFLILQKEEQPVEIAGADKASINFYTDHSKGSLAKVLTEIAAAGINLSKLQSFPIPGSDWRYSFHADVEFDSKDQFDSMISAIKKITEELKIYGVYKKGEIVKLQQLIVLKFLQMNIEKEPPELALKKTIPSKETATVSLTAKRLEGIGEYYFSQKLREIDELNKAGKQVINLGIGSPDLPPHPDVIKTLHEEALKPNQHAYQNYKGSPVLRNAISKWYAKWYGVILNADTEILPLIGSKEGIMHICMTYINEGDTVLIPNPGYPTYRSAAKIAGANVVEYTLLKVNNWFPDFGEIEKNDLQHAKLMFVNYPQMPTGQLPATEMFEQLIAFAKKHGILLVHDNPYSFILNDQPMSLLSIPGAKDVAIELNSLSKSHNMAGWRIGMLVGNQQRINEVLRFKSNMDSGMFLPLQLAAAKALELGQDWHDDVNNVYKKRREKIFRLLELLNCKFDDKQAGMFVWAAIPDQYKDGYQLSDKVLYESNVFITPGGIFGSAGDHYIRVSLCTTEEKMDEAIRRISETFV